MGQERDFLQAIPIRHLAYLAAPVCSPTGIVPSRRRMLEFRHPRKAGRRRVWLERDGS